MEDMSHAKNNKYLVTWKVIQDDCGKYKNSKKFPVNRF